MKLIITHTWNKEGEGQTSTIEPDDELRELLLYALRRARNTPPSPTEKLILAKLDDVSCELIEALERLDE